MGTGEQPGLGQLGQSYHCCGATPEPLVAASCRDCRSSSSLSSPNPAGFVSPDQKGPVWLASCTLGAVCVRRKCGSHQRNRFSQSGSPGRSFTKPWRRWQLWGCMHPASGLATTELLLRWMVWHFLLWPHPLILLSRSSVPGLLPASPSPSCGCSAALLGVSHLGLGRAAPSPRL